MSVAIVSVVVKVEVLHVCSSRRNTSGRQYEVVMGRWQNFVFAVIIVIVVVVVG